MIKLVTIKPWPLRVFICLVYFPLSIPCFLIIRMVDALNKTIEDINWTLEQFPNCLLGRMQVKYCEKHKVEEN